MPSSIWLDDPKDAIGLTNDTHSLDLPTLIQHVDASLIQMTPRDIHALLCIKVDFSDEESNASTAESTPRTADQFAKKPAETKMCTNLSQYQNGLRVGDARTRILSPGEFARRLQRMCKTAKFHTCCSELTLIAFEMHGLTTVKDNHGSCVCTTIAAEFVNRLQNSLMRDEIVMQLSEDKILPAIRIRLNQNVNQLVDSFCRPIWFRSLHSSYETIGIPIVAGVAPYKHELSIDLWMHSALESIPRTSVQLQEQISRSL